MAKLPRAILFDLDDTLLVAFGPAESQWQRVIGAYRRSSGAADPAAALAAIHGQLERDLWADPARHKHWRHRIGEARRHIVANAFADIGGARATRCRSRALGDAIADRYNALHDAELRLFPGAHETLTG